MLSTSRYYHHYHTTYYGVHTIVLYIQLQKFVYITRITVHVDTTILIVYLPQKLRGVLQAPTKISHNIPN